MKRWRVESQFPAVSQFGLIVVIWLAGLAFSAPAVNFSISPTTVSNTYVGNITLTITSLTNGETVTVQQFLDVNTNGVIDGPDLLVGQWQLTDGLAMAYGGVTNLNVPGDLDSTPGQITSQLPFQTAFSYRDIFQSWIGKHLVRVSSPTGRFPALTNSFAVTNASSAQWFTGNVQCSGTNVPYALVALMIATNGDGMAGTITDSNGNYTLNAPPGDYQLFAGKSNLVCNMASSPSAILYAGVPITMDFTLIAATQSISGLVVDSATTNGLGGLFISAADSNSGQMAAAVTDTNGNFTLRVNAGSQWKISTGAMPLAIYDHFKLNNSLVVNTTTGSVSGVTMALPMGTAIIYGSVKDDQNHAIPGLRVSVSSTNAYSTGAVTDQNGNYYASAIAGGWNVSFLTDVPLLADYLWPANGVGVTATNYQATELNFVLPILGEPYISQPVNLSGGRFGFTLAGSPGTNYTVLASTNLATTNWFTLMTTNLSVSPAFVQDNQATNRSRFYRVKRGP
jgi:hypothetical protein